VTGRLRRATRRGLFAVAAVCGSTVALAHIRAQVSTTLEQDRLDSVLAGENPGASGTSPAATGRARAEARPGRTWGRFVVPRLGVSVLVAEGVDERTLGVAVGHFPGSAFPGEVGNVALAGHRDTVYRVLEEVWPEDVVLLTTQDGIFEYRVEWLAIVDPDQTDVVAPSADSQLTLVTRYPFEHGGRAPLRYVVRARYVERVPRRAPDV
jgi:LPXTG-site transpeptidase (sortase) family protein